MRIVITACFLTQAILALALVGAHKTRVKNGSPAIFCGDLPKTLDASLRWHDKNPTPPSLIFPV